MCDAQQGPFYRHRRGHSRRHFAPHAIPPGQEAFYAAPAPRGLHLPRLRSLRLTLIRVGGKVDPPRQTYAAELKYPALAKAAKVEGVVVIEAIIDEQGSVVQAHVVSGPALLICAALESVGKWKYEPTRLNGEPVSVEMNVKVHFNLQ